MEVQGLVSTKKDLNRKNWLRVSLTKKGEKALERWLTTTVVPDAAFSCLSRKERDTLCTISRKLHGESIKLIRRIQPNPYSEPLFW